MKKYIFILFILSTYHLTAQEGNSEFDIRFGTGLSLLGSGDMTTLNFENELNYKFNKYFTSSFSVNYGRSNTEVSRTASFIQGNINIFLSPFTNNGKNDFRMGSGFSLMNISESYPLEPRCGVGLEDASTHFYEVRNPYGFNIILENTYAVSNKFLVGVKLFSQVYSGDINSGVLLKFGVKL